MAETDPDPGFTFVDRRRRPTDGDPPSSSQSSSPGPEPASPPSPEIVTSRAPEPMAGDRLATADLSSLCVMLYGETLMHLGQVPDQTTGQPQVDLEQARFSIDLLAMLRDKTEGNRTPDESAMLEEMLATLRLAYVRFARG